MMSDFYRSAWNKPYLTPSIAVTLLTKTPYHARLACPFYNIDTTPPTAAMAEGSIVDGLFLGAGPKIVVLHTEKVNTKIMRKFRDNAAAAGKIPMKAADFDRCKEAAAVVKGRLSESDDFDGIAGLALCCGEIKKRLFWKSGRGKVPCSTEPDIHLDIGEHVVLDLKRTRVTPTAHGWRRHCGSMNYHVQAASAIEATGAKRFGWIVIEADPPHLVVVHWATPAFIKIGQRDWRIARDVWAKCVAENHWPGYESGEIDPMPWLVDDDDSLTFTEETDNDEHVT